MARLNLPLIKGSIILLVVFNLYSFLNFIYQSSMARLLTLAEYGMLAALFYFVYVLGIFSESTQTIIARYTAAYAAPGRIKNILRRAARKGARLSILFFVLFLLVVTPVAAVLLDIPVPALILFSAITATTFFIPILRGTLQGRKQFTALGTNLLIEAGIKVVLASVLVWFGWKLVGAITGFIVGLFVALFCAFLPLRDVLKAKEQYVQTEGIYRYSAPVFIMTLALFAFYTADIFIAQIVFPKELAGTYAVASMLSKIIFWGTQPISRALFPLSAETLQVQARERRSLYFNALALVTLGAAAVLALFVLFPDAIIRLFSGKELAESARILFVLGLATTALSYANLNIVYSISRGTPRHPLAFLLILALGIALLLLYHETLMQFALAFLTAATIFLWGSVLALRE